MPRLAVVFCQYDTDRYRDAFARLRALVPPISGHPTTYVRVDNAREGDWSRQAAPNLLEVGGDNSAHEFSAWSRGIGAFDEFHGAADCYLFVTDAFLAYGDDYEGLIDGPTLDFLLSRDAVGGLIDRPGRWHSELQCMGRVLNFWIRTSFFVVTRSMLDRVGGLVTVSDMDEFCPSEYRGQAFADDAPMNTDYKAYVERWVTERWHSAFELSEATWDRFRGKTRSILNEHALSGRLGDLGAPFYDLRFLRERRRERGRHEVDRGDPVLEQYRGDPLGQLACYRRSTSKQRGLLARLFGSGQE